MWNKKFLDLEYGINNPQLSRDISGSCSATESAFGVKAFFLTSLALPANNALIIGRAEPNVVVFHYAVALTASCGLAFRDLRINSF
jgi:hypothetical protein